MAVSFALAAKRTARRPLKDLSAPAAQAQRISLYGALTDQNLAFALERRGRLAPALFHGPAGYTAITLGVMAVFTTVIVGMQFLPWRTWRHHPETPPRGAANGSFREIQTAV